MNRGLRFALGPELVMLLAGLGVYAVCARHPSGEGADLLLMERLAWTVPPAAVALAFATVLVPGAATGGWLLRANLAAFLGAGILTLRILAGFGDGAKGQDAGFILAMMLAGAVAALGTAITGAMVLARAKPGFGAWYRKRPLLGAFLTLLAAIPIGVVLGLITTTVGGLLLGLWVALSG